MDIQQTEVAIIGGGLNGLTLALALGKSGIPCIVVDAKPIESQPFIKGDGRTTALAHTTVKMFEALGLWEALAPHAGAIQDIRIVDGRSTLALHFNHRAVSKEPMGYIVENPYLRDALVKAVKALPNVSLLTQVDVETVVNNNTDSVLTLTGGKLVKAKLVALAVGKNGTLVEQLKLKHISRSYGQKAIIFTLGHSEHHQNIALERFQAGGPFAVLPLAGGQTSGIVWTEKDARADALMALSDADFMHAFSQVMEGYLGTLEMKTKRMVFPISIRFPLQMSAERMALVGDAAHTIHPIAGQGYNLGVRDAALLTELVVRNYRLGLDTGSKSILSEYARGRMTDITTMVMATDGLNRLFSNDLLPISAVRKLGLAGVQKMPGLKNRFMRHAMGMMPGNPKLLMGEKL